MFVLLCGWWLFFACGFWYDGTFNQINGRVSRFGTRATNERKAIWYGGNWINGQFHSSLVLDSNNKPLPAKYNGYSIWYSGIWNNGIWYGGTCYQINWQLGTWYNGVLYDIDVIEITNSGNTTMLSSITLDGMYYFNLGDTIWIIDDNDSGIYSALGSISNPVSYLIQNIEVDIVSMTTTVFVFFANAVVPNSTTSPSGNKVVSYFRKVNWHNGIWFNGIFNGDNYYGGIWFNGIFQNGNWLP